VEPVQGFTQKLDVLRSSHDGGGVSGAGGAPEIELGVTAHLVDGGHHLPGEGSGLQDLVSKFYIKLAKHYLFLIILKTSLKLLLVLKGSH